jgi:hypothetical protein
MSISAWMTDAARRALRREDGLASVQEWEAQHGPLSDKEMQDARRRVQAGGPRRRARARRSSEGTRSRAPLHGAAPRPDLPREVGTLPAAAAERPAKAASSGDDEATAGNVSCAGRI